MNYHARTHATPRRLYIVHLLDLRVNVPMRYKIAASSEASACHAAKVKACQENRAKSNEIKVTQIDIQEPLE